MVFSFFQRKKPKFTSESESSTGSTLCMSCSKNFSLPESGAQPPFGSSLACPHCHSPMFNSMREYPYTPPNEVKAIFGYPGCSLINATCPWCSKTIYSVVVPENGHIAAYYWNREQENPGAVYVLDVNCPHCSKKFVIEWDESPFQMVNPQLISRVFLSWIEP